MKIGEVLDMKTPELYVELDRVRRHVFDLRAQAVTEKLANPYQLIAARQDVARILTVLRQRNETGIEQKELHLETTQQARKRSR